MPAPPITDLDRAFSRSNVLIRDLDPTLHSVLSGRAEARGQSLQQYLTAELTHLAERPILAEMLTELEQRPPQRIPREAILKAIRDGRRDR